MDNLAVLEANMATNREWPSSMFSRPEIRPYRTIQNIFSTGFALNSTTPEPYFGRGERWRRSFPVRGHVRLQYGQIVHKTRWAIYVDFCGMESVARGDYRNVTLPS